MTTPAEEKINFRLPMLWLWLWLWLCVLLVALLAVNGRRSPGRHSVISKSTSRRNAKKKKHRLASAPSSITPRRAAIVPTRKTSAKGGGGVAAFRALAQGLVANAEAALVTTGKVQRQLKTYFSSDYEQLLLRMTSPTDTKPDGDDVGRFVATIETFVRNLDVTAPSNPYRVTLRKLWTKAAEPDGRTTLKALYLLHTVLRLATPEDAVIFKTLLNKMVREPSKKPAGCRYFDLQLVAAVSAETAPLQDAIETYAAYVFQRAKTFTSSFEEMRLIA